MMGKRKNREENDSVPIASEKKAGHLICGYFGFGNLGDEAILDAELAEIKKKHPEAPITVMSHDEKADAGFSGISFVNRYSFLGVIRSMRRCNELIFGGGGLLQDATSIRSLLYYYTVLMLASRFGMKITVLANGIGPLRHDISKMLVKKALSKADAISVRDRRSAELLKQMGVSCEAAVVPDPASALIPSDRESVRRLLGGLGIEGQYYVVSLRSSGKKDEEFLSSVVSACGRISFDYGLTAIIMVMNHAEDRKISLRATTLISGAVLADGFSAREAAGVIAGSEFVLGARLHSLIFAKAAGKPFYAFSYDPKVKSFSEENGGMGCSAIDGRAGERLFKALSEVFNTEDYAEHRTTPKKKKSKA